MYYLALGILLLLGVVLLGGGLLRERLSAAIAGLAVIGSTIVLFGLFSFWAEMLWFQAVGYSDRFWTVVLAKVGLAAAGALLGTLVVYGLTAVVPGQPAIASRWPEALGFAIGAMWGLSNWGTLLRWWYAAPAGTKDPVLSLDVTFYLFSLPFYESVYGLLWWSCFLSLIAAAAYLVVTHPAAPNEKRPQQLARLATEQHDRPSVAATRGLYQSLGAFLWVIAAGMVLHSFHLMFSQEGTVAGAGWTDIHVRLPAFYLVAVTAAVAGTWVWTLAYRGRWIGSKNGARASLAKAIGVPVAPLLVVALLALGGAPQLSQWLWVLPNEITVEKPYIERNIALTRHAFGLTDIEEQKYPVSDQFNERTVDQNSRLLSEIRLWDPRALLATYEQFQEIRLYYEFRDVDIDRYTIGDRYRQVMVSAREMKPSNLPKKSQTFVNRHFKYTHGYGLTLAPVSDFTEQGLPVLLIKDLPPRAEQESLVVERPEIYYGELTEDYVVANSEEREFDFPRGDRNVYSRYEGSGGVPLRNLWRKLVFGWKLGGTRFLLSGYPSAESRIMFRRQIRQRLDAIAPFLDFDGDPYIVLQDGRMYWFVDAYTTSSNFPYSERFTEEGSTPGIRGANYVRNSVKAVINAYDGSVSLYVFEPDDPIIQVWQRIFPKLFKSRGEMPTGLAKHIRYPEGLLAAQGAVYSKYHMTDPSVFYNQEDLWVRATEKYYANVQPVEPYYVMWKPPESEDAEFVIMQPFTPKNRQVLIGWMAGMCDDENYGRLLAYRFPKEKRVLGTQQVETKIDQDSFLSGQLTLWDQQGSRVIRGNLLVIPLNGTLLYVEPIYLQAEAAAYPELRLVALMHNDRLSYAETFDEALEGLLTGEKTRLQAKAFGGDVEVSELAARANQSFRQYLQRMGEEDFRAAAEELTTLQSLLERLEDLAAPSSAQPPEPENSSNGAEAN